MIGSGAHTIAYGFAVGAALLSLWLFVRYPAAGPRAMRSCFLLVALGYGALQATGFATAAATALAGPAIALLAVYLPILTFAFWAALQLMRAFAIAAGRYRT